MTEQAPHTAAGRALLSKRNRGRQMYVSAKRILAIEAEAAAPDPVASPALDLGVLSEERRGVVQDVTEALLARGWTFQPDEGPEADVREALAQVYARAALPRDRGSNRFVTNAVASPRIEGAAQPAPPTEALRLLRQLVRLIDTGSVSFEDDTMRESLPLIREARRYLAATEETP